MKVKAIRRFKIKKSCLHTLFSLTSCRCSVDHVSRADVCITNLTVYSLRQRQEATEICVSLTFPLIQLPCSFSFYKINWNDCRPHIPFYSLHAHKVSSLSSLNYYLNDHYPHDQQFFSFSSEFST